MAAILTLDLGTTYFKVCLFEEKGKLLGVQRVAPPIAHPEKGRWELTPEDFRGAVRAGIGALAKSLPGAGAGELSDVAAISFATQTNSFCLLGKGDAALTPLILWADERAVEFNDRLHAMAGAPGFRGRTGVGDLSHIFMAGKLLWLAKHEPEVWARAARLCLISDYLTLWLTGERATEAGAAGLTGLVDIKQLAWAADLYTEVGLRGEMLPRVVRAGTDVGRLRPEAAAELGLPRDCRLIMGCLDQYAGAIGAGNITHGGVSETTGTVLAAVRCAGGVDAKAAADEFQGPSFAADTFYRMSFGSTSANLLEWYRNQLPDKPDFETLGMEAAKVAPGAGGLKVKLRADLETLGSGFVGMKPSHGRGQAVRAIMEAVAFALRDHVGVLCGGRLPAEIRSSGGAARSDLWLQIKADVLNTAFVATTCPEPTSLGAALLAAHGLGWGEMPELVREWVRTKAAHRADAARHEIYMRLGSPGV